MIIDLILDRRDDEMRGIEMCGINPYDPAEFYRECMQYSAVFDGIGDEITRAMDFGTEDDVRDAICNYIVLNGYNVRLFSYVRSRNWIS